MSPKTPSPMSPERDQVTQARAQRAGGRLVPKGEEREVAPREPGDQNRADHLERAREILEQLEERQEVPLGAGGVVARRIGRRIERSAVLAQGQVRPRR